MQKHKKGLVESQILTDTDDPLVSGKRAEKLIKLHEYLVENLGDQPQLLKDVQKRIIDMFNEEEKRNNS